MAIDLTTLDAHEQPADELKKTWKAYSRTEHVALQQHPDIDDTRTSDEFLLKTHIPSGVLRSSFKALQGDSWDDTQEVQNAPVYYHPLLPGLLVLPSLIPPQIQKDLLDRIVHRDLSNPTHQTNLHLHYDLPYREGSDVESRSFFSYPPDDDIAFAPKDADVHRPLSIKQVMLRRLTWVTLGGQYDWTNRVYPEQEARPDFPTDIADFLHTLFPETDAQAAIVNFYTPSDTMMMHRDVSEKTDKGLVSLSLGCDALFMIAPNDYSDLSEGQGAGAKKKPYLLLRLRSGDAIYMTGESRYAWHGVPKVLKDTCPDFLADWPAEGDKFAAWKGWMKNKRVNLNVRQMQD
ncbi:alkylated DNA repair protein alkB homolog-like 1 [Microdochium nivale]|nr:alkylated DNA repair protein alkB homolog-like 1 [Microdochium nivale]